MHGRHTIVAWSQPALELWLVSVAFLEKIPCSSQIKGFLELFSVAKSNWKYSFLICNSNLYLKKHRIFIHFSVTSIVRKKFCASLTRLPKLSWLMLSNKHLTTKNRSINWISMEILVLVIPPCFFIPYM